MPKNIDTFILKKSHYAAFRNKLTIVQKGHLLDAIYCYHIGEEYELHLKDAALDMVFSFIKEFSGLCEKNYEEKSQQNSANAKARWNKIQNDAKNANASERIQNEADDTKQCLTYTNTCTCTDSSTKTNSLDNSMKKEEKKESGQAATPQRFIKPSIQEVADYAASLGYSGFNTERFYAYYESNGWMVGKNKMKDWKAAVRNWYARDKEQSKPSADYRARTEVPDREVFKYAKSTI